MRKVIISLFFAGMLVLCGCPMMTQNSIDEGSYSVPEWLKGKWYEVKTNGRPEGYDIEATKDKKGHFQAYSIDSLGNRKSESFHVILSDVGGVVFWNVYDPGDDMDPAGWYLYKFQKISNNEFVLTAVKEKVIDFAAPQQEIKAFLMKNKDNDAILSPEETAHYKK
jgi:hypothetical protein